MISTNKWDSNCFFCKQQCATFSRSVWTTDYLNNQIRLPQFKFLPLTGSSSHSLVEPPSGIMCNTISSFNFFSCSWILYSGANGHVCFSLDLFSSYYKIKPIIITLPNDNCVMVHYVATSFFTNFLSQSCFIHI